MINYLYCKVRHSLLFQSLDMFLSDSVDLSCFIAKSVGQYNAQKRHIPRANGAERRARVLIRPGYLHPGKRKH